MPRDSHLERVIVAIDGPAGAGKSTVARRLAKELGYMYMDTGAMYRAFAWDVLQKGLDLQNEVGLRKVLDETMVNLVEKGGRLRVRLNGLDVTDKIRTPELSQMASRLSSLRAVRERMVGLQRDMGKQGGVVAEGRDIGTVVFPRAEVKIYLEASEQERARRRYQELEAEGKKVTLEETLEEMIERDRRDQERAISPLCKAEDAIVIDSTSLEVDSVVQRIMEAVKKKIADKNKSNTGE
ncbi:MAG: (d)CMP kinase [Candidatus Binatia bacterium]